jgi:hypothetical protein
MKNRNLFLAMALVALGFTSSCKDEKETQAEKSVDTYVVYVDSIEKVNADDAKSNWEAIDNAYQMRINEAEAALENMKDRTKAEERINASKAKYEELRTKMEADAAAAETAVAASAAGPKQQLRNALFGEGKIGDDMNFSWVNKDNIHAVYQQFVHTAEDNKDKYSREDWDEVKLLYEALDSRKNTVEKEGLSAEDNRKIAGLKVKFAPMLTVNRMGAKNGEMQEAKK